MTSIITCDLLTPYLPPFRVQEAEAQRMHLPGSHSQPEMVLAGAPGSGCTARSLAAPPTSLRCWTVRPRLSAWLHSPKPAPRTADRAVGSVLASDSRCGAHGGCAGTVSCRLSSPRPKEQEGTQDFSSSRSHKRKRSLAPPCPRLSCPDNQTDTRARRVTNPLASCSSLSGSGLLFPDIFPDP